MAYVDGASERRFGGEQVRADDVADIDPVAGLSSIAEHGRPAAVDQRAAKDRHDPCLAVYVLARPVHVAVAQRHGRKTVQSGVELAITLGRVLALSIRRQGPDRIVLGRWAKDASPYSPPPVDVLTMRRAPADRAASRTSIVPSTLDCASFTGCSTE